ncbi:MAG TPA: SIS domain-containing protein [Polyangia bacterium]|jgi:glucosamine--fructose-6-phosphate aminotransferase (isomerizing)
MSTHFAREIREQPTALARLLATGRGTVEACAEEIRRFGPRFVVTAARGSSDNAARYGKYLFGAHNRLVVSLGAPSLLTRYQSPPSFGGALIIGISQSGESPDIVALVDEARRQGALTVTVTNAPDSALARAAHQVVDLNAGPEQAVVASKSYSCELLALAMLSAAVEGRPERWHELERIPEAVAMTLSLLSDDVIERAVAPLVDRQHLLVLGRGFNFATAFELALKMKETAHLLADPYATPDLQHGPMAMIDASFPALVVAPTGACFADATAAAQALVARGAQVVMLSDAAPAPSSGVQAWLPIASAVPEWLSPLTAIIPGQLCALALARARGLDADRPRGLSKVTRTL